MQRCTLAALALVALAAKFTELNTTGVASLAAGHPAEYVLATMLGSALGAVLGSALGAALGAALGFGVAWPEPDPAPAPGPPSSEAGPGSPFTRAELREVVALAGDFLVGAAAAVFFAAHAAAAGARKRAVGISLRLGFARAQPFSVRLDGRHNLRVLEEVGDAGPSPARSSMQLARALWCRLDGTLEDLPSKYARLAVRCALEGPAGTLEVVISIDAHQGQWSLDHPGAPGDPECTCFRGAGVRPIALRDARVQALLRPLLRRGRNECARIAAAVG